MLPGAAAILAEAEAFVRQHNFVHLLPEVAAAQVLTLLHQGNLAAAAHLAQTHELPISQARVHLAQGDPSAALAVLEPLRQQVEAKGWEDERLKVMVLQAVAHHAHGEKDKAVQVLGDALALAEPGGFIRLFVDEGLPMAQLMSEAAARGIMPDYTGKLLAAFEAEHQRNAGEVPHLPLATSQPLIEPLSERELEILQLIAQGLSNREISERLFLALDTVKGHNRRIFRQTPGSAAHRSRRPRPRVGSVVGAGAHLRQQSPRSISQNNTPTNTFVSMRQHRRVAMLFVSYSSVARFRCCCRSCAGSGQLFGSNQAKDMCDERSPQINPDEPQVYQVANSPQFSNRLFF